MLMLGPLGFAAPWLLLALAALPVLWVILRAIPPSPRLVRFPGTALLAGLADPTPLASRTPWWLLALRCLALALLILGLAGPVWRPVQTGTGPLLIVMDAGWAAAPDWQQRQTRAGAALANAAERPVALLIADGRTTGALPFEAAATAEAAIRGALPAAWATAYPDDPAATLGLAPQGGLEVLWLSDGLDHPGRAAWLTALAARGPVTVVPPATAPASLTLVAGEPPGLMVQRAATGAAPMPATPPAVLALGPDPQGVPRVLARLTPGAGRDAGGVTGSPVVLDLPPEQRNRVTRFEIEGAASAGATWLADDRTRRRKVGLVGPTGTSEAQALLAPLHYLRQALGPRTELVEGALGDVLQAAPDVLVLADVLVPPGETALGDWVRQGGTLIRFAGPRMAAAEALADDPLLPLPLRPGGRDIGGALSWGDPRGLAPFPADGPFAGLTPPAEVAVRAQLMAQPGPDVAGRTLASLSDGTPLVTRLGLGEGQVVMFHVSANAEWSDLPLSGLYLSMLDRLIQSARLGAAPAQAQGDARTFWTPQVLLDGSGREVEPGAEAAPVADADLAAAPRPGIAAGLYRAGQRERAVNAGVELQPARWPGATVEAGAGGRTGLGLQGWALALAIAALAVDAVASGLLSRGRRRSGLSGGARAGAAAV